MSLTLTATAFETEQQAVTRLEAMGCSVLAADVEAQQRGLHGPNFATVAAVVSGALTVSDELGEKFECGPGSLLDAPLGQLHTEMIEPGRLVFGFPAGMPDFASGIHLDPADHPDA